MAPKPTPSDDHAADKKSTSRGGRAGRKNHKKRDFSNICAGHSIDDILNTNASTKHRISAETRETLEQMARYLLGQLKDKIVLISGRRNTVTLTEKIIYDAAKLLLPQENAAELKDPSNNMLNHALAQMTMAVYRHEQKCAPAKAIAKDHQKRRSLEKKAKEARAQ